MALTWDFVREIDPAASPGNTTSYYDTWSQNFYIDNGYIKTQIGLLNSGDWLNIVREPELIISDSGYSLLDIEHHFNGAVFGIAQKGSDIVFLMYDYLMDITPWVLDGSITKTPNPNADVGNGVEDGEILIANDDIKNFEDGACSLFYPGNKIKFSFIIGDNDPVDLGTYFIETSKYENRTTSYQFNGRNTIGFFLMNQTFDENTGYTGTRSQVIYDILTRAGITQTDINVELDATALTVSFADDQTYISGLKTTCDSISWKFAELPDGKIVAGTIVYVDAMIEDLGSFSFTRNIDVITRSIERSSDSIYKRVCVRRRGLTPLSIYADIPTFDCWGIVPYKTYYYDVSDAATQGEMEIIRDQLLEYMEYRGAKEVIASPFRPQVRLGNTVALTGGDINNLLGYVSKVFHRFGRNGYYTQIDVDSGTEPVIDLDRNTEPVIADAIVDLGGGTKKLWTGTQTEYEALSFIDPNVVYIVE